MTLEQLRVLHAVVTQGSFRGAAQELNKSQPALSLMLKKLEDILGFQILSRDAYRPVLTKQGSVFYAHALRVLEESRELLELSQTLGGENESEVHLGVSATCPLHKVLSAIDDISQVYPSTHIRLSIDVMGGPLQKLMNGDADMIIATRDGVELDDVSLSTFEEISIVPVCHANYEAAQMDGPIAPAMMAKYPQIVVSGGEQTRFEQSRDVMPENRKWSVSDFQAKKEIIKSKMGWGGLPMHLIEDEIRSGELKILNLDHFPVRHSQLMLMRRRGAVLGPVAKALWQRLSSDKNMKDDVS
jgi:DNA-binding transcriptional LysR family regulator